jgi:cytochrome c-type biogenesis protein
MIDISHIVAFTAGLVSFLSPCVLPIIPGFLAYLSGATAKTIGEPGSRVRIFMSSVFFVLGFSTVFALLGVLLNSFLISAAYEVQLWLSRLGGLIIIFFGLYLTGLISIGFLNRPHTIRITKRIGTTHITSFVFGAAFAVGWTPCVGAALGAILGLAASSPGSAFSLLFAYSVGLGVPFLLVGLFAAQAGNVLTKHAQFFRVFNIIFGVILIGIGVLVFTQSLSLVANLGFLNSLLLK